MASTAVAAAGADHETEKQIMSIHFKVTLSFASHCSTIYVSYVVGLSNLNFLTVVICWLTFLCMLIYILTGV